ncbi:class I SAM-dependent methyltransferase [Thermodesulfobacteriota bacterium]
MKNEQELYTVDQLPIFQNLMYDSEAEAKACPKGDVRLVENLETGLIYNASFRPELMVYDAHYQNEQAVSPIFQQHLDSVVKLIKRTMGQEHLVELGCGKGSFLEILLGAGFDVTGFDPTYEGTNPRITRDYFGPGMGINANGLVLRHVLEHIKDPISFLQHLRKSNGGSGLIYIEVPCFDWICTHRAWFDVFYEHVNYFRLSDFHRIFDTVIESGHFFGDQYIYVVADLAGLNVPELNARQHVDFPGDFLLSLKAQNRTDCKSAVWGGASKGVIFTLLKLRIGQSVDLIIDINPSKQGKYVPATGLKVYSPENGLARLPKGSTIYVMNSNYREEIKQMSNYAYEYVSVDYE